jgi:uncharacterized membrane protein
MGPLILLLGLAVFLGVHVFVTFRPKRTELIARWGEGPYKLAFSLISVIGLVLVVYGFGLYRETAWIDLWYPPRWTRHIAALLMWPAILLLFATYLPGHIKRAAKHPMLVAVKLWALAHLITNGDLGSIILFGSFLAWAVYDRIAVKRRERAGETGAAPVIGSWRNDAIAVGMGTLIYLALGFAFHPVMIGVPAFGG